VEVLTKAGRGIIRAAREVILCAGVYGSPQLLMLSGVGPSAHLRRHGITVVADLPVGDNLHDHLFVPMTYCMTSARNRGTTPYFAGGVLKEAIRGDSWMGRTVFEVLGLALRWPYVQCSLPTPPVAWSTGGNPHATLRVSGLNQWYPRGRRCRFARTGQLHPASANGPIGPG
jgi:GMC oxidoreductase